MICPQEGKKKEKVPGFFYNLKQMNPFAKKQPKANPEAAETAPAEDGDKEESKELLDKDEKGGEEKGDEDKEGEKKDEDAEKKEEGENIRII